MNKNNKVVMLNIGIGVMLIILGITYAVFTFTKEGTKINQITTGTITMTYTESSNVINIQNALPISDAAGMILGDNGEQDSVFDFSVGIDIVGNDSVSYEVTASRVPQAQTREELAYNEVKLYLEKSTDNETFTKVADPSNYVEIGGDNLTDVFGASKTDMRLDSGVVSASIKYYYKLRMWVDQNYQTSGVAKSFSVRVNAYGKNGVISVN